MRWILAISVLLCISSMNLAQADLVYFTRGGQAPLAATLEGDQVRLETPDGPQRFPRSDFLAIVPEPLPEQEWPVRRDAALKAGTIDAKFAADWWALENGLTAEAIRFLNELRPLASTHSPLQRILEGLDSLRVPCPDPELDSLRNRLRPLRFREVRSAHIVLLHQGDEATAKERLDVLERVAETFLLMNAAQGMNLAPLRKRLVSVYFAEHRDYVQFLKHSDADAFLDTQGYHHPTFGAVFAFDTRSSDEQKTGRRAILNRKKDGTAGSELARQALLLDLKWRETDLGIAAHETVHQLITETGLAPRFNDFPTWLHEGLAAQFEVVRGGRWVGVGRAHDLRLPDWRAIHPAPKLVPLVRDIGFGHGYRRDLYAESWALVYYLRKTHPREFLSFLDLLRAPVPIADSRPDRAFEAFRAAFGNDLDELESGWHRYLADLKTPLEAGRPAPLEKNEANGVSPSKRPLVEAGRDH